MDYENPESTLPLKEGLAEYYGARDDLVTGRGASERAREFFRCHDTAHVVFGCGTTLPQEAVVKIWSFFGTTAGLGLVRDYRLPESQEIYRTLGWREILSAARFSFFHVPIVLSRCLRMHRRWPWSEHNLYLTVPLLDIRREFGIRVLDAAPSGSANPARPPNAA